MDSLCTQPSKMPYLNASKGQKIDWVPIVPIPDEAPNPPQSHYKLGKPSHVWEHRGIDGRLHFFDYRFPTPNGNKEHRPLTYCRDKNGNQQYRWGLAGLKNRTLYGAEKLATNPNAMVAVCEGAKTTDAASKLMPNIVSVSPLNGSKSPHLSDWIPLKGRHIVIFPDNDKPGEEFRDSVANLVSEVDAREVWIAPIPEGKPAGWDLADGVEPSELKWMLENFQMAKLPERATFANKLAKMQIEIKGGELPEMVDAAENALMAQPNHGGLFQRGGQIVRVIRLEANQDGVIRRAAGLPLIIPVEPSGLTEAFTKAATWRKLNEKKTQYKNFDCPKPVGATYAARAGMWKLRPLTGLISAPTMRRDGSILETPGYDERTGLLFLANEDFPPIPKKPTKSDAVAALEILSKPISQFPFVEDFHKSVALSAIITALVRRSIKTAPLHGFSAPTMGSGKSLLADVAAIISTGYPAPAMSQGGDETEDRKKLLASLIEGDSILLIDNVNRPIEGGVLCSALTQMEIRDRILGLSKMVTASTAVTIMATGNNLTFRGDMTTRALLCRIDPGVEKPEEREFQGDLKETVRLGRWTGEGVRERPVRRHISGGSQGQMVTHMVTQKQKWPNAETLSH